MTQTLVTPERPQPTLNALDRCDRCGAQAYTRFVHETSGSLELFMCAHHTKRHANALTVQGFVLDIDERALLDEGNRQQGEDHA